MTYIYEIWLHKRNPSGRTKYMNIHSPPQLRVLLRPCSAHCRRSFNSWFPLLPLLNTTTMILCGYFIDNSITRPKSMLVVVFRIRNKGNRPFIPFTLFSVHYFVMEVACIYSINFWEFVFTVCVQSVLLYRLYVYIMYILLKFISINFALHELNRWYMNNHIICNKYKTNDEPNSTWNELVKEVLN